jgi:phytochrome-interacting factor 3
MLLPRRSQQPGNDLAELLWQNGPPLRRTAAAPFPPFACTAAGTSRAQQELARYHPASVTAMRDLLAAPDDDAVPWPLHYPVGVDDDDSDTAPLPPEYCSTLLSGYSDLPGAAASRDGAGGAPSTSHCAVVVQPPMPEPAVPQRHQQPRPSAEGIMNFTFFSRPLQRAPQPTAAPSNPVAVESTVPQASTNRLRSTPLFSEQRMAWLQPPKESRATVAPVPPPPPPTPPVPIRQGETSAALPQRIQPEARAPERPPPPPPAMATTSSVCSDNVDRSQLKRGSSHQAPEWSVSQEDEVSYQRTTS